jgi:hypothetical protein
MLAHGSSQGVEFQQGIGLRTAGRLAESREVLSKVLADRLQQRGAEHPETWRARSQLGRTLRELGELELARQMHAENVAICIRQLGRDHEWTKSTSRILADTLERMGRADDAVQLRQGASSDEQAFDAFLSDALDPLTTLSLLDIRAYLAEPNRWAALDTFGDLYSRKGQGKDNGMLSS